MSYILFADSRREVKVSGRERALLGQYANDFPFAFIRPENLRHLPVDPARFGAGEHDLAWSRRFMNAWGYSPSAFQYEGDAIDTLNVGVNTMTAVGGPLLGVVAWIHGQCEVHGYIEGEYRDWLADQLDQGVRAGLLREHPDAHYDGWGQVAAMLRGGRTEPVVMSYSVCDTFPEPPSNLDEEQQDAWYNIDPDERWIDGLTRLRGGEGNVGALDPRTLPERRYGDGKTIFDLAHITVTA
jgi:hypothetical protein